MKKIYFLLIFSMFSCHGQGNGSAVTNEVHSFEGFSGFEPNLHLNDNKIHVVNFWATWCAPCVKELPNFEKLNAQYKEKNVEVLLVSLDMAKDVETKLVPFVKKRKLQSQVVHLHDTDADAWISKVDPAWTGALPATVIYGNGKRKFYERSFTYEELENEVKQFIN